MSQSRPFVVDSRLTGIALAYTNRDMIADAVMPRVPVGNQQFKWLQYNKADRFTIPNTLVGRKGLPNEVEFGATEVAGLVMDYALDDVIPNDDVASAPQGYDPLGNATELTTELLMLDREVRVAAATFTTTNHAGNAALTGGDLWSDPTSDIIGSIMDTLAIPLMRPNVMVTSGAVRDVIVRHPAVVKAVQGNSGDSGIVADQAVANLFGLQAFLYSRAIRNTAVPGQSFSSAAVWANKVAFLHQNRLATNQRGYTWGYTAQWQTREARRMEEPKMGLRGAVRVRVGESVNEIVSGTDGGYLLTAVI